MNKILVPIDGSEHAQRALEKCKEMAVAFGSDIVLINIKNLLIPYLSYEETRSYMEMMNKNSEDMLKSAKQLFSDIENKVEIESIEGDIASSIIKFVEENDIDLVIMGSQGLNAGKFQGFLLGSIANKVIHSITTPILIVR
ncbi:hypothetical protein GC105_02015 [Alkalibaculum sp. M08DMB]|uniref:UspA domain-containing protein n=1 Tax=Alkalibaculum sporogenes TaxID=2655001 RepID=A0A6A7K589_9FIRM|nr:universal stress protein [Alkalibaculum sporogenes]MPW24568.1 hypothetical protein [Alkalibaculum sporogenes]